MQRPTLVFAGLLAVALTTLAGTCWARNDKLMQPLESALRSNDSRQPVAPDIALRFGKASAAGQDLALGSGVAHGVVDPFGPPDSVGRRLRRSDEQLCVDAFRRAAADLQNGARARGASAVVGIVSHYNGVEMDSAAVYECHVGHSRAVVDLKGQFARGATPPATMPAPAAAVAAPPLQARPAAAPELQPPRIASGFAAIDDIDAIPLIPDRGRQQYVEWLGWQTPRAFAIAPNGHWWATSGIQPRDATLPVDPGERALLMCHRSAGMPCKLYAVNGSVVWPRDPR